MKLRVLALCLIPAAATAQTSQDYAIMSRTMWAAFVCGYYAETMEDQVEAQRLYNLGIEEGRRFLTALEAGQVDQTDLYQVTPWGVSARLGGSSHDFIIGRIFEGAMQETADQFQADGGFDENLSRTKAQLAFQEANCALIRLE